MRIFKEMYAVKEGYYYIDKEGRGEGRRIKRMYRLLMNAKILVNNSISRLTMPL